MGADASTVAIWTLFSGVASAVIDLDVYGLVIQRSVREPRLRPFRSMAGIYREFPLFMKTIEQTGILRKAMLTHLLLSAGLCVAAWALVPKLLIPATIAAVSHIASDVPNILKVVRAIHA
jgi:hypothetical protein